MALLPRNNCSAKLDYMYLLTVASQKLLHSLRVMKWRLLGVAQKPANLLTLASLVCQTLMYCA